MPHGDKDAWRSGPACPVELIPKPTLAELRQVFEDVADGKDFITAEEVIAAFAVNNILLTRQQLKWMLRSMDPDATGEIGCDAFASALYTLSLQHREVSTRSLYAVFPDSDFRNDNTTNSFMWKRKLWSLLEEPTCSAAARITTLLLTALILLSTGSFLAESSPIVAASAPHVFSSIELTCVIVFTMEYLARFVCTPSRREFVTSFFSVIDLLAIAPYYLELMFTDLAGTGAPMLRAVRVVRVFRLLKIGRYVAYMRIFGRTLRASAAPLGMLAFVSATMITLWATMAYFIERGTWVTPTDGGGGGSAGGGNATDNGTDAGGGDPSSVVVTGPGTWINDNGDQSFFTSIPASFWWAIVSMTTVGYGDTYAITGTGRLLSALAILTGIMLTAIPISIVTGNLHAEYDRMDKLRALRAEHDKQPHPGSGQQAGPQHQPGPHSAAEGGAGSRSRGNSGSGDDSASDAGSSATPTPVADGGAAIAVAGTPAQPVSASAASSGSVPRTAAALAASATSAVLSAAASAASAVMDAPDRLLDRRLHHHHPPEQPLGLGGHDASGRTLHAMREYTDIQLGRRSRAAVAVAADPALAAGSDTPVGSGAAAAAAGGGGGGGGLDDGFVPTPLPPLLPMRPSAYASSLAAAHTPSVGLVRAQSYATMGHHPLVAAISGGGGAGSGYRSIMADAAAAAATATGTGSAASSLALPLQQYPSQQQQQLRREGDANAAIAQLVAPLPRSSGQVRRDAAWSEPFLRSTLQVIRGNRRRLMSSLKALELHNREHAVEDVVDFVGDMRNPDRGKAILKGAAQSGLID